MMTWKKTKAPLSGAMQFETENGRYKLNRVWTGNPMKPRWTLNRVSERTVPRHWVEPYEDYDEVRETVVREPGYWAGPYEVEDEERLAEWPDSPTGPTRRASEWITNNMNCEVAK